MIRQILYRLIEKLVLRTTEKNVRTIERFIEIQKLQSNNLTSIENIIDNRLNENIVVSLTTFGKRINEVYLTIESLARQTVKPKRILLWLDEKEFNPSDIPKSLKLLETRGLEIMYCPNLKSYKKLVPTLLLNDGFSIITVDDDIIYNRDMIEVFFKMSKVFPDTILCGACKQIKIEKDEIQPYDKWESNTSETFIPSKLNIAIGFGGVYYPKGIFDSRVLDKRLFMNLAPNADDLWFKVNSILNHKLTVNVSNYFDRTASRLIIFNKQEDSLSLSNVLEGQNDIQFKSLLNYFNLKATHFID
jgi:hypothetical protein